MKMLKTAFILVIFSAPAFGAFSVDLPIVTRAGMMRPMSLQGVSRAVSRTMADMSPACRVTSGGTVAMCVQK